MNRVDFLTLITITGFILSQSIPSIPIGPLVFRLQDLIILILVIFYSLTKRKLIFSNQSWELAMPLVGLAIYSLLILPIQPFSVGESLFEIVDLMELIFVLLIFPQLVDEGSLSLSRIGLKLFYILAVIGSVLSIFHFLIMGDRFVGVWYIIGLPAVGLFLGVSSYYREKHWLKLVGIFLIFIRILFARSRSRWLLIPVASIFAILLSKHLVANRQIIKDGLLMSSFGLFIGGIVVMIFPPIQSRFQTLLTGSQGLFARPVRYFSGLQLSSKYPLGVGLGNYSNAVQNAAVNQELFYPDWFSNITGDRIIERQLSRFMEGGAGSHSDIFQLLLEVGLIGLVFLLLFWGRVINSIINGRNYPYRTGVIASIIYLGFQSVINTRLLSGSGIITVTLISLHIHLAYSDNNLSRGYIN